MSNPIIIDGDTIYFSLRMTKPNGLPTWIVEENLFSPLGFLVPINANSLNILTALEGSFPKQVTATARALLIDHVGVIHEVTLAQIPETDKKTKSQDLEAEIETGTVLSMIRVPYGKGVRYVRDTLGIGEMIASAIIDSTPSDQPLDHRKIITACENQTNARLTGYVGHDIQNIVIALNKRFPKSMEAELMHVTRSIMRKEMEADEVPLKSKVNENDA